MSVVRGFCVQNEQNGSQDRTLRNAKVEQGWLWKFVVDGNSLRSIGKVGSEPAERCTRNFIEVLKSLRENVVIYGVECSYIAIVDSMQNVMHHFE